MMLYDRRIDGTQLGASKEESPRSHEGDLPLRTLVMNFIVCVCARAIFLAANEQSQSIREVFDPHHRLRDGRVEAEFRRR